MSKEVSIEKSIALANSEQGVITVSKISEPYGEGSAEVASIGVSLRGNKENPDWKVHIPMDNLDEVIEALQSLK